MYEAKMEFPWGMGVQNKKPSMGGAWLFSETARYTFKLYYFDMNWDNSY